jgi:hypothetical protein
VSLSPFDGRDVITSSVAIRNAGDGLSQAMSIEHTELHHGQTVYVVLECEVTAVEFPVIKDTESLNRKHILRAGVATLVSKADVDVAISAQRKKIDEAKGIQALPLGEDPDDDPLGVDD